MTKILIVDDNEQNLYMLQVLLKGHGYEVVSAKNGAEALEKARRDPPDMIITDILMPVMDGFALCREWKKDQVLKAVPFVFYTATYTDPRDKELALNLGADGFIIKPMEIDAFLEMVRDVLEDHEAGKLVASGEPVAEEAAYLKEYNGILFRKLEDKLLQLEEANLALERDITKRKKVEVKLKKAAEEWLTTFNSIVDMVSIHDKDFKLVKVNKAFADTFKVKPEELIGKKCYEIVHGTKEPPTFCPHKQTIDTKKPHRAEFFEPRLGVHLEMSVSPIFDEHGELTATVHISKDITERKKAEETLQLERNKLTAILDSMADGVYIVNQQNDIEYINPVIQGEFGSVDGRKCYEYFRERKDVCPWCKNKDVFAGKTVRWEWYSSKNQKTYDLIDTPLRNSDGSISKLEIFRDITAYKKAEEKARRHQLELAHISRLSTIGQMASELTHELNQPLCATLSHLEGCLGMVKSGSSDTGKILKKLETAIKQINQAGAIVSRVKGFAIKGKIQRSTAFINDIILEALRFSETELRLNHITTELNLGEKIQPVLANSIQIEQVILNLIQNATEAMKNIPKKHRKLIISTTTLDNAIEVAVKDTGKGMDKDKGQNIFESFVTTKSEGLGIGLSISQSIIESHGGRIYFKDNSEHGVTFCFTLPLITEKV